MDFFCTFLILLIMVCFGIHLISNSPIIMYHHNIIKHTFKNNSYTIYEINNILNKTECSILIKHSLPNLKQSSVMSNKPLSDIRTSTNTFLHKNDNDKDKDINIILDKISNITEKISGKSKKNHEPLQIVNYKPNQLYKEHYDCCVPLDSTICKKDREIYGMRHSTLLIYLNDIKEGGETDFPLVNYSFKPKLGHGIFFFNLNSSETDYNILSKHAGLPPIKEDKWVCNKWVRTKPYTIY